ncbi:MAG: hypothetical protein GEU73_07665 [Chloroflexi bacterium]|nr:hypothetical protein [Chloroflexota bacterium]
MSSSDYTIRLLLDANRFKSGADDAARGADKIGGASDKAGTQVDTLGGKATKVGKQIQTAFAVVAASAVLKFGKELLDHANVMDGVGRRVDTVFGDWASTVREWADENNERFGMSSEAVAGFASQIGDILIPLGFAREEAADMAMELSEMANALSEWTGGAKTVEQAGKAVTSALTGEREMLKEFGIVILEADVQARLAADGLDHLTGEAEKQAKAQATLNLIQELGADAFSAYAEGALEGEAAVKRAAAMAAEFKDSLAQLMQSALVPTVQFLTNFAEGLGAIGGAFGDLDPRVQAAIISIGLFFVAFKNAPAIIAGATQALGVLMAHPVIAGLAAVAAGVAFIGSQAAASEERVRTLTQALEDGADSTSLVVEMLSQVTGETIGTWGVTAISVIDQLGLSADTAAEAIEAGGTELDDYIERVRRLGTEAGIGSGQLDAWEDAVRDIRTEVEMAREPLERFGSVLASGGGGSWSDGAQALDVIGQRMSALAEHTEKAARKAGEAERAAEGEENRFRTLADASDTVAESLSKTEEAQRSLSDAMLAASDPVFAAIDAISGLEDAQANLDAVREDSEASARDVAEAELAVARATAETQAAIDAVDSDSFVAAVGLMSESLDKTEDEVIALLETTGLLDDAEFATHLDSGDLQSAMLRAEELGVEMGVVDSASASPSVDPGEIETGKEEAAQLGGLLALIQFFSGTPNVDSGDIDSSISTAGVLESALLGLGGMTVTPSADLDTASAYSELYSFESRADDTIYKDIRVRVTGDSIPGRQGGGSITAGQPYIVGESGPELIFPDRSGWVATASQTMSLLSAAGGAVSGQIAGAASSLASSIFKVSVWTKQIADKTGDIVSSIPSITPRERVSTVDQATAAMETLRRTRSELAQLRREGAGVVVGRVQDQIRNAREVWQVRIEGAREALALARRTAKQRIDARKAEVALVDRQTQAEINRVREAHDRHLRNLRQVKANIKEQEDARVAAAAAVVQRERQQLAAARKTEAKAVGQKKARVAEIEEKIAVMRRRGRPEGQAAAAQYDQQLRDLQYFLDQARINLRKTEEGQAKKVDKAEAELDAAENRFDAARDRREARLDAQQDRIEDAIDARQDALKKAQDKRERLLDAANERLANVQEAWADRIEAQEGRLADVQERRRDHLADLNGQLADAVREQRAAQAAIAEAQWAYAQALMDAQQAVGDISQADKDAAIAALMAAGMTRTQAVNVLTALGVMGNIPQRAMGGPVRGGQAYLVGEAGPEVIVPTGSGYVVPNRDVAAAMAGPSRQTNLTVQYLRPSLGESAEVLRDLEYHYG